MNTGYKFAIRLKFNDKVDTKLSLAGLYRCYHDRNRGGYCIDRSRNDYKYVTPPRSLMKAEIRAGSEPCVPFT